MLVKVVVVVEGGGGGGGGVGAPGVDEIYNSEHGSL